MSNNTELHIEYWFQLMRSSVLKYGKKQTCYLKLQESEHDLQIIDRMIREDNNLIGYRIVGPYQSDTPEEDLLEVEFFFNKKEN
jgi:hypothetical protein